MGRPGWSWATNWRRSFSCRRWVCWPDYARQAFVAADHAFAALDDQLLQERGVDIYGRENSVAYVLLVHLSHAGRHLGMIEALRGVRGLRGTATV